jgi:coproporphyrinogen III oxidase-like Fe-S oxidoreductase
MSVEELYPVDRIRHMPFLYYPNVNTDTDPANAVSRGSFGAALARRPPSGRKAVLYVHVPFCKNHCTFCFYNIDVVKRSDPAMQVYLDALLADMQRLAESAYVQDLSIEHVFIGGGTPSMLPDDLLRDLLVGLRKYFDLSRVVDFNIEMHLETMTRSNLELCHGLGVNRVSFGWQTSIPRLRKLLALLPSEESLLEIRAELERLGFPLVLDLMYALPTQTDEEWDADLQRSIELGVACIDLHRCDIVPPAPLYELARNGRLELPAPQRVLDQYRYAYRTLVDHGYAFNTFGQFVRQDVPEAISHHGRYMYRSSHDLLALGPGAIGTVADHAYMNTRDLLGYATASNSDDGPAACICHLEDSTWQERDFVLGLGQLWSVPKALLREPLSDQQAEVIDRLCRHDALAETADSFRLTESAVGYHFSISNEFVVRDEMTRNIGYVRSIRSEIARRRRSAMARYKPAGA